MKYKNNRGGKRRIVPTLLIFFLVLLYPLFPGILVSLGYEMPIEFGPLYSRVGIILIPVIIGIYSWQAGNIHLALIVSLYPHILLFIFDFFTLKVLIWIWIYIGICLSLMATGMVLVNSDKKIGIFIAIAGIVLWIMRFLGEFLIY